MRTAQDLLSELNASDESPRIEAKRAREAGKSILETVIAFANEQGLGGGHVLQGVNWEVNDKGDTRYWAAGVPDRDKRKRDLDSLQASNALCRLRDRGLLEKNALHTESPPVNDRTRTRTRAISPSKMASATCHLRPNHSDLL